MDDNVSGRKQLELDLGQHTTLEKVKQSFSASVYKSSEEDTTQSKTSGLRSVYKSSEECHDYQCDPCKSVGENAEAKGFCNDCKEHICCTCLRSHTRNKFTRNHVIVKIDKAFGEIDSDESICVAGLNIKRNVTGDEMENDEYTFVRDINVKSDTDKQDCYITDMTFVSKNEIVLGDIDNQCLKLVDINKETIKDVLALQSTPWGITAISNDQVAVALANMNQIQIVTTRGDLNLHRKIKTNGECADIKMRNKCLYVSFVRPVKFQILQSSGAILRTIKPDDEVLKHCTFPRHIAVSPDESRIYVSDLETNKVLSFDKNGNMMNLYQGELDDPEAIIISLCGSVYICNRDQNIIYKMTSSLSETVVMLGPGDGLQCPHAMCLDLDDRHLYISSGNSDRKFCNFLKVFKCYS